MRLLLILAGAALLALPGCATSRYDQLRNQSQQAERDARLQRLNGLWASLTAVDIALAATRHAVSASERPVLYDAIEEAYDTISWNAPLPPGAPTREMPDTFRGGRFMPTSPPG